MSGISLERWHEAQEGERRFHNNHNQSFVSMRTMYESSYKQYFAYVEIDTDLKGKRILEIGCADIPALYFCSNYIDSAIIEPLPSKTLDWIAGHMDITIYREPAETLELDEQYDEIWLFNVLQHVIDPDKIVSNCKEWAHRIRYFEPIDTAINEVHPHSFTLEQYKAWFGDAKYYDYNKTAVNFHQHCCAYGEWRS